MQVFGKSNLRSIYAESLEFGLELLVGEGTLRFTRVHAAPRNMTDKVGKSKSVAGGTALHRRF